MAEEDEEDDERDGDEEGGVMIGASDYGSKLPDINKK
jgi:hypothetical protein